MFIVSQKKWGCSGFDRFVIVLRGSGLIDHNINKKIIGNDEIPADLALMQEDNSSSYAFA